MAIVSYITDVLIVPKGKEDYITVIIILIMVISSGILRFVQEAKSETSAEKLKEMVEITALIKRKGKEEKETPIDEIVVGDIVYLAAGDMIPADLRFIESKDLFISQSALTGESESLEKLPEEINASEYESVTDYPNLAFMGSNVISGSAKCVVINVGSETIFGTTAKTVLDTETKSAFEKGVNSVSWLLIRFMLIMVPVVFFINGYTKGDWLEAFLFAVSIAVGLTPEMLPMIVTTCLSKGAVSMSKKKTIIKNLNSIQDFGSMDILCTDKTGTLTQDKVVLEYHIDVAGKEDIRVLRHGFLNSYFQTGLKNLMDLAIIDCTQRESEKEGMPYDLIDFYKKIDEVPFDFNRRRMSVVLEDKNGKSQMITKGAVEEMLGICSFVEYEGIVSPISKELINEVYKTVDDLNDDGLRVIAVAQKTNPSPVGAFSVEDEKDMVLLGFLAFLDPPKESTEGAIKALHSHGVEVKVLTGDNDRVTKNICRQVGLKVDEILLGSEVDNLSDEELKKKAENTTVFAKLSPMQKQRIVKLLKEKGHTVGYMGDGINDAAALKESDVGISVDSAVDIAKESADVILLEKDLNVLEDGILEGRKTYSNMIKYIKITASSNFGNVFSILIASAFLPFLPMTALHLIILNLIYDMSCTALPWDNVDPELLNSPKSWDASDIKNFMIWLGPISSIFDILTFACLYFIICPSLTGGILFNDLVDVNQKLLYISVFQAGWFIESMFSQTLVIHMLRTEKTSFIKSNASVWVNILSVVGILICIVIPFTTFGEMIEFSPLPANFFLWLLGIVLAYIISISFVKNAYIKKYGKLL